MSAQSQLSLMNRYPYSVVIADYEEYKRRCFLLV